MLFSTHSETATCKNGEIVRLLRSETLHFMNCFKAVIFEDGLENFPAIFSKRCSDVF